MEYAQGNVNWQQLESQTISTTSTPENIELTEMSEETLLEVKEKEVITGTVVGREGREILINVGLKSDGLIPVNEFKDESVDVGAEVEVYLEEKEDDKGQIILSRRKARIVKVWEQIEDAYKNDKILECLVKRRTKGGLIVDISDVEAFLPGSQIDVKPIRDFDQYVGKTMELKVIKINYENDNVVVSHRILIEKDLEEQREKILVNLERGQVLEGTIKNMTTFGVFIDLGGVDGLLHITDISWGRISHPQDILELDQKVNIVVLDFDDNKKRISLGMKQLQPHPWDALGTDIQEGSVVEGKVVNLADYGAFLEIAPGVEGLVHVSEMSWSQHLRNPKDFVKVGDKLTAKILTINTENRKMSFGIKQLTDDPWDNKNLLQKYQVDSEHEGLVRNMTNFGLFVELEEGIDGLVHISDLSWTKKYKHPSDFISTGERLQVKVLELNVESRRLGLGVKQMEENPWDTFAEVFEVGTLHDCTVLSKVDRGFLLELPYGLEGYVMSKNARKEDGSLPEVGDALSFEVIDFVKDDRKIVLSHTHTYRKKSAKELEEQNTKAEMRKINKGNSKTFLGDTEDFSKLREDLNKREEEGNKENLNKKAEEDKENLIKREEESNKEENKG